MYAFFTIRFNSFRNIDTSFLFNSFTEINYKPAVIIKTTPNILVVSVEMNSPDVWICSGIYLPMETHHVTWACDKEGKISPKIK